MKQREQSCVRGRVHQVRKRPFNQLLKRHGLSMIISVLSGKKKKNVAKPS